MAAQRKDVYALLAEDRREEPGRSPRQSQLLFQPSERAPVEVAVCVVQVVAARH